MTEFTGSDRPTGAVGAAALPGRFRMRYEVLDFTPGPGVPMGGYGWGVDRRTSTDAPRRLKAKCVVLVDAQGQAVVLVSVDVISTPRHVYHDIRQRLLDSGAIADSASFVLAQSHTHHGPMVGAVPDPYVLLGNEDAVEDTNRFTEGFTTAVVDLVRRTAAGASTPVRLGYAEGLAHVSVNRVGLPWTPREVPVLVARHADSGQPELVLFGHACHPVCQAHGTTTVDSDYCGRAAEEVERRLDVPAMFFQGAAGDLEPPGHLKGGEGAVVTVGDQVADAVVAMVRNQAFIPVTGPFRTAIEEVSLPFSVDTGDPAVLADLRARYQERIDDLGDHGADGAGRRHARRMVAMIDEGRLPTSMPMTLQRLDLGGLTVLTMAHEVLSGYHVGTKLKYTRPLWIVAYANHVDCYVAADDVLWAGGYEAGWRGTDDIAGIGTAANAYSLPAPLKAFPRDRPGQGAEQIVAGAIDRLLGI